MVPPSAAALRALVVGAVTWDVDAARPERPPRPGGTATIAARVLARLGCRTGVVTRVATLDRAHLIEPLRRAGIDVLALPSSETTRYRNGYGPDDEDTHELLAVSDPVRAGDVPADWLREAHLIHAGPLHPADVEPGAAAGASGIVGVDLQGLVRGIAIAPPVVANGVRAWGEVATVVQASATDATVLFGTDVASRIRAALGVPELLVTRGAAGATLATEGETVTIPVPRVTGGDRRGAGDTHLAVYLAARALGESPVRAAALAGRVTARALADGAVPAGALG